MQAEVCFSLSPAPGTLGREFRYRPHVLSRQSNSEHSFSAKGYRGSPGRCADVDSRTAGGDAENFTED